MSSKLDFPQFIQTEYKILHGVSKYNYPDVDKKDQDLINLSLSRSSSINNKNQKRLPIIADNKYDQVILY
jgi:hypothetical protein